jgi:predicted O-methyltransferase YrrM
MSDVATKIARLPEGWHGSGSVGSAVLDALQRHAPRGGSSMETGTGRTTLLLSHLSATHLVFTKNDEGTGDSLAAVRSSPLLGDGVTFVVGPTQSTVLGHEFGPLDLALLDGPHAYPFPDLEYWAVYPHVKAGGLLVVDDVQIPTVNNLFRFLRADAMWELLEVVETTAFFRRTTAPTFNPLGDGWHDQGYNARPRLDHLPLRQRLAVRAKWLVPQLAKDVLRRWL